MLKMLQNLVLIIILLFSNILALANLKKIGVLMPIEHESMNQIVQGIKEALGDMDVEIITKNAHNDINLQYSLIKQLDNENIDIIMPIGTSTCQMSTSHIKKKPIVCVAAKINQQNHANVTGVDDEIPFTDFLAKFTSLNNLTVIYSASEKTTAEIKELKEYEAKYNISLHFAMIQVLADLPAAVRSAPQNTQAFLMLKDHLIVSGINILIQEANKRFIPVIALDEGSAINGATIAIGVKEKSIGLSAGLIAKQILNDTKPNNVPYEILKTATLFINEKSLSLQNILIKSELLKSFNKIEIIKNLRE